MLKTWEHNKLQTLYLQFYFKGSGLLTCRGLASAWYISSIREMPAHSLLFQKGIHCFLVFLLDYIEAGKKIGLYAFVICNDDASQVFLATTIFWTLYKALGILKWKKQNKTQSLTWKHSPLLQNTVPYSFPVKVSLAHSNRWSVNICWRRE